MDVMALLDTFYVKSHVIVNYVLVILAIIDSIEVYIASRLIKNDNKRTPAKWLNNYWIKLHFKFGLTFTNIFKIAISIFIFQIDLKIDDAILYYEFPDLVDSIVAIYFFYVMGFSICLLRFNRKIHQGEL
jgi:hypothetical protein